MKDITSINPHIVIYFENNFKLSPGENYFQNMHRKATVTVEPTLLDFIAIFSLEFGRCNRPIGWSQLTVPPSVIYFNSVSVVYKIDVPSFLYIETSPAIKYLILQWKCHTNDVFVNTEKYEEFHT